MRQSRIGRTLNGQRSLMSLLALLLVFGMGHAGAEEGSLTEEHVRAYIDSLEDLRELARNYRGDDLSLDSFESNPGASLNPMQLVVRELRNHPIYPRFSEVVDYHGFQNPEHWAVVADAILVAYIAVEMDRHRPGMREQMAERGMPELAEVPPRHMALVEAHTEELREAFDVRGSGMGGGSR
ncbi:MAG: hypothetical protein ACQERR_04485 [Pseudomonadota bacterium]